MPSIESIQQQQQQQQRVDRSTSPLPQKSPTGPVQELKALFAEPSCLSVAPASKQHHPDSRHEAVQSLQAELKLDIPDRGSWGSKVCVYPWVINLTTQKAPFIYQKPPLSSAYTVRD
jgi:hypothetical protein